jgi:CHAD domain-containing protein
MPEPILTPEERASLLSFVGGNSPGTAYLQRANILLLADDGLTQEQITAQLQVPITHVRQMLRAYKRQRMALFPADILTVQLFSADEPMAEAGRRIMARLVLKIREFEVELETTTSVTALHESRKAIRQLRTAFRLFRPYYEPGILDRYRRRFRKLMRRLGRSRDLAVFIYKLELYMEESETSSQLGATDLDALRGLRDYWQVRKQYADEKVRHYLAKSKYTSLLAEFERFCHAEGESVLATTGLLTPSKVGHLVPAVLYEKLANVRAYDIYRKDVDLQSLHALRIQLKELRYALEFFQPVLGISIKENIDTVKKLLTHLGDLNDARVHMVMLDNNEEEGLAHGVGLYHQAIEKELIRLLVEFPELWARFDSLEWRQQLSETMALL